MDKRQVVVFDFDGTLVKEDTFITFAIHALGRRRLLLGIIKAFTALAAWKLRMKSNGYAKQRLFAALYAGMERKEINRRAETFKPKYNGKIIAKLLEHKRSGAKVYIITASIDLWMQTQADLLGIKLCCTQAEVNDNGLITGHFSSPNCYGEEKLRRLLQEEPDRENYFLTVYGDSVGDSALFRAADNINKI